MISSEPLFHHAEPRAPESQASRSATPDPQISDPQVPDPQVLDALMGLNCDANRAVVQRTRRTVRDAALSVMEARRARRRNAGIATVAALVFLVLLSPAMWSIVDDLLRGDYLSDITPMVTLLLALLFSGVMAALIASRKNQYAGRHERRNF